MEQKEEEIYSEEMEELAMYQWFKEDFNRLQFILAEYLGMQSSKLDKQSLQELHDFVHKALNEYWTMTNKEEKFTYS